MALEAAWQRGLALRPISAAQIVAGALDHAQMLVVPGGWSTHKKKALGHAGGAAIAEFIKQGGVYLGFCGGAGLALSVPDGLGLVPLGRASGAQRLPGLSGPVMVRPARGAGEHALWQQMPSPARLLVWWPGQFDEPQDPSIQVIARYQGPTDELCLADLEQDPAPLWGQPAVVQARLGRGRLFLSYLHLDTPGDQGGGRALERLWAAWLGDKAPARPPTPPSAPLPRVAALAGRCAGLWEQGRSLGLWRARHPAMPLWQRGARGLEFWEMRRLAEAAATWCHDEDSAAELEAALAPVLASGGRVLEAQAARLAGREPEAGSAEIEASWFPRPRRSGGDWALAMEKLANALLAALIHGGRD
jgi:hypothetical protein